MMLKSKMHLNRLLMSGAVALAAMQLTACTPDLSAGGHRPVPLARAEGAAAAPIVISSDRARDTAAYVESEEELSEADWRVLERFGPRSIWEQLDAKSAAHERARRDARIRAAVAGVGSGEAGEEAGKEQGTVPVMAEMPEGGSAAANARTVPTMGPTTAPSGAVTSEGATTRPIVLTAPPLPFRPAPAIDESKLPVKSIVLPDGRVRLIWVLRSYGGSTVASTRDAQTSRRAVTLGAPDLTSLVAVLSQTLGPLGTVTPMPRENTLVITCQRGMKPSVLEMLNDLDVPQPQVEITAKIFEVSRDFDFQQGTNLLVNRLADTSSQNLVSSFSARRFLDSIGGSAPVQGSALRLMRSFADAGVSLDVTFQLLADAGLINVVSSPRMTVAVGQTGYMLAGQELPIQSANIVNNVLQTATEYKPVGVQLYITPQAVGDHRVKLHTISIVSSVSGFSALPSMDGQGSLNKALLNPIIDSREAETAVTIDDGSTLVISGLRMTRTATRENKTPGLGDVPGLGWLFKNHRSQQQQTDLYFFVTPKLLEVASAE
jgi:type II secretory pathway component GspD/PulD (secretin)